MNMSAKKLLIIGLVWPEPTSSAAGTRMIQLIDLFLSNDYQIIFACAALKSDFSFDFTGRNVVEHEIKLNDSSFNSFVKDLNPGLVLFDRFMIEEQYGWRVQQECPDALKILDTEDLHFLRNAREQSIKKQTATDLFSDLAKREIASILRSDLSLIISEAEMKILTQQFKVDGSILHYLPFLEEEITPEIAADWIPFEQRADFVFIGNFLHEPNWNTVQTLKNSIWPALRKKIPGANLNIYGSYASQKVLQLENKKEKFFIKGRAQNARETLSQHKILLAPIQFGAGVKGKFIDAMQVGTPSVTTQIGAEAMKGELDWNGFVEDNLQTFVEKSIALYTDKALWTSAQIKGVQIINQRYNLHHFAADFTSRINDLLTQLTTHRQNNFFGQILNHQAIQHTKYMSLWIEEKNKHK
ncbi:glycosyltransferase [Pedobacter petrophilus]|uniref:Glycosyltransferase n=2 Tax=Pedobacter petrophilus TaxID=1908241 RepID=A0A7K0FV98_9SPHI|nr:glycosyltransferase [Pedobacter petrophilus]